MERCVPLGSFRVCSWETTTDGEKNTLITGGQEEFHKMMEELACMGWHMAEIYHMSIIQSMAKQVNHVPWVYYSGNRGVCIRMSPPSVEATSYGIGKGTAADSPDMAREENLSQPTNNNSLTTRTISPRGMLRCLDVPRSTVGRVVRARVFP